jgi:hypothetical protein
MSALLRWLSRMLGEQDGTPSSKRVAYVGAFLAGTACVVGALLRYGLTALWVDAFTVYLATFTLGYVGGKFADRGQTPPVAP